LERTLEELETRIAELEEAVATTTHKLANPQDLDATAIADLGKQHAQAEADLLTAMAAWDEASDQLAAKQ
jgi:cell division septum initiation protein DivIVA